MTFSKLEIRAWARKTAAKHPRAGREKLLIIGYAFALQVVCDGTRRKEERRRIGNLMTDALEALKR